MAIPLRFREVAWLLFCNSNCVFKLRRYDLGSGILAQGADFGVWEGANYSFEFCTFLVPITDSYHPILRLMMCKNFRPHPHTFFHTLCVGMCKFLHNLAHPHICKAFLHMIAHDQVWECAKFRTPTCVRMCKISHFHTFSSLLLTW